MENKTIEIKLSSNVEHDINVASVGVLYAHGINIETIADILEIRETVVKNIIEKHSFLIW